MRVHIDVEGADQLEGAFDAIHSRSTHLRPAFEVIGDDFRGVMARVFSSRGAVVGGWPPPTRRYAARKSRVQPDAGPGVFTGILQRSLTRKGARYARQRIEEHAIVLGTKAPHAHLFHEGRKNQRPRRLIPRRDVLQRRWAPIISHHIAGHEPRSFTGIV